MLQVALVVKEVADEIGLQAFPKTSGSSGIHIYVPLKPTNEYDKVAEFSRLFASEVAQRAPKIATVERTIAKRKSDAGLRRLDAERARQEFGCGFHGPGQTRSNGVDAVDLETGREGREDPGFHDHECAGASEEKGRSVG